MRAALLLLTATATAAACTGSDAPACRVGSDCVSGVCRADGTCAPADADSGVPTADAPVGGPDGATPACDPDHDGVLARDEITLAAGLSAPFLIAADAPVSTTGMILGDGSRRWDLTAPLAGDHAADAVTLPLAGQWFAAVFPGASYAARLTDADDLLGVFEATSGALLLRGVVSPTAGPGRTELTYDPPIVLLTLPFQAGTTWSSESTVSGLALGVFTTYSERYDSLVDAVGEMTTPYGPFPVLRVATDLTRTVGFLVTTVRTYLFVAECYGTVAAIRSQDNEPATEFTNAAEVRRLTP